MEAKQMLEHMLGRTLFVVHSEPIEGAVDDGSLFGAHLRCLQSWERRGVLFAGGPYRDGGRISQRAMYILRAASRAEAAAIAAEEPLHAHGIRRFSVDEWVLNQGRVGVTIDFSTQRGALDADPCSKGDHIDDQQGAS